MQGFSLLDLFPADLRAAKNPKRRRRRTKRTRKRRSTRRRRRRTRTSIPRKMQPHHPPILPQIGIRGSWLGMRHHQWKTGGRIQESHDWHLLAFQNSFFTPRIISLSSLQAPPQENAAAAALRGIAAQQPPAARHGILGQQQQQQRRRFPPQPRPPPQEPEQGRPRPPPLPAEKGQEKEQVPLPAGPRGPAAPRHRLGGLRKEPGGLFQGDLPRDLYFLRWLN